MLINKIAAGIVPVYLEAKPLFLVLRAYSYWDFPKGVVEPDENEKVAALRELKEETGIECAEFRWGDTAIQTPPYSKGKIAKYFLAEVKTKTVHMGLNLELGRPEHSEFRWLTYEQARVLFVPRLKKILDEAQIRIAGTHPLN